MAAIGQFASHGGWVRGAWTPDPDVKQIVEHLFAKDGTLLIGIACEEESTCHLAWLDDKGHWWSIASLPYRGNCLQGKAVEVRCDATKQVFKIDVEVKLTNKGSRVKLRLSSGAQGPIVNGPVGTYIADANPGQGDPGGRKPRG